MPAISAGSLGPSCMASPGQACWTATRRNGARSGCATARHRGATTRPGGGSPASTARPGSTAALRPPDAALDRLGREIAAIGNAENESGGIELGYCYAGSPAIATDRKAVAPDDPGRYQPSTVPGVRLPSVQLPDGSSTHDRLGPWFTLVSVGCPSCSPLIEAAARRGVPLTVVAFREPFLTDIYGCQQLLVRPDQHIAWRGTGLDESGAEILLARATGSARLIGRGIRACRAADGVMKGNS